MPIVTLTKNDKTRYHAVTDGDECRLDALVTEYEIADSNSREYAEYALKKEYLRRLTEHAYDCAHLLRMSATEPDESDPTRDLDLTGRLALKIANDAIWLRTCEPFTALTVDVVARGEHGTGLQLGDEPVSSLDNDSWRASEHALWEIDPWRRDHFARIDQEKAEKEAERVFTPAGQKLVDKAKDAFLAAIDRADKLKKRSEKTVANKTVRRAKRTAKRRAA